MRRRKKMCGSPYDGNIYLQTNVISKKYAGHLALALTSGAFKFDDAGNLQLRRYFDAESIGDIWSADPCSGLC